MKVTQAVLTTIELDSSNQALVTLQTLKDISGLDPVLHEVKDGKIFSSEESGAVRDATDIDKAYLMVMSVMYRKQLR